MGPRPGSVARALGVQTRANSQEIMGSLSAEPERRKTFFLVSCLLLLYHTCITPSFKLSSSLLCGSHGATAVAHQALPFVTATDGASECACERHVSYRNEHILLSREGQERFAGGKSDTIDPHFLGISKTTAQRRLKQHQRYNSSTTAPALQALAFVTAMVLLCSYVCSVQQETFRHVLDHDYIYFHVQFKNQTRRPTSS